jgi:hypothetical protein
VGVDSSALWFGFAAHKKISSFVENQPTAQKEFFFFSIL